jgi:hypothetical protein
MNRRRTRLDNGPGGNGTFWHRRTPLMLVPAASLPVFDRRASSPLPVACPACDGVSAGGPTTRNCPLRLEPSSRNSSRATARITPRSSDASRQFSGNSLLELSSCISTARPRRPTSWRWKGCCLRAMEWNSGTTAEAAQAVPSSRRAEFRCERRVLRNVPVERGPRDLQRPADENGVKRTAALRRRMRLTRQAASAGPPGHGPRRGGGRLVTFLSPPLREQVNRNRGVRGVMRSQGNGGPVPVGRRCRLGNSGSGAVVTVSAIPAR